MCSIDCITYKTTEVLQQQMYYNIYYFVNTYYNCGNQMHVCSRLLGIVMKGSRQKPVFVCEMYNLTRITYTRQMKIIIMKKKTWMDHIVITGLQKYRNLKVTNWPNRTRYRNDDYASVSCSTICVLWLCFLENMHTMDRWKKRTGWIFYGLLIYNCVYNNVDVMVVHAAEIYAEHNKNNTNNNVFYDVYRREIPSRK